MDNREEGKTVKSYVRGHLRRSLALLSRQQWVNRVQSRQSLDMQAVPVLDAVRAERDDEARRTGARAVRV